VPSSSLGPGFPAATDPRLALARWYNEQMLEWNLAYYRGGEAVFAALRSFDQVSDHVRGLQPWLAARAGHDDAAAEICIQLPRAAGFMASVRLDIYEQMQWSEAGLKSARRLGDRQMELSYLGILGNCHMRLGDAVQALACYRAALDLLSPDRPPFIRATLLANIGLVHTLQDRFAEAVEALEEALALARAEEYPHLISKALQHLGTAHLDVHQPRKAILHLNESLEISTRMADPMGRAGALNSLGNAWAMLGELDRATDCIRQSLVLRRRLGNSDDVAGCLLNLGNVCLDRGDVAGAVETLQEALHVIDAPDANGSSEPDARRKVLNRLGKAWAMQGELGEAERLFREALGLSETNQDSGEIMMACAGLGFVRLELGELNAAGDWFDRAITLAQGMGNRPALASGLYFRAWVLRARGQHAAATDHMRAALAIYEALESPDAAAVRAVLAEWERAPLPP
jgi:tetratricopeptide (TPR) repeat protein